MARSLGCPRGIWPWPLDDARVYRTEWRGEEAFAVHRVALFCETYHEINGVALTARQLVGYAKRHDLPLLAIHGGKQPGAWEEGNVRRVELKRSWGSLGIECDLEYDFFFWRYVD